MIKAGVPIVGSPGLIITDRLLRDAAEDVGGHCTIILTRDAMAIAAGRPMNGFARAAFDRVEWDVNALTGLRHWRVSMEFIPYDESYQEAGDEYGIAFPTPKRRGIFPHSMAARCRLIREADQSRIRLVRFEQPIARPMAWEMKPRPLGVPINHPDVGRLWHP